LLPSSRCWGSGCQKVYQRYRKPESAEHIANWAIPGGRWLVFAIIAVVLIGLAIVVLQDPLQR
jgi:hypothetical protein